MTRHLPLVLSGLALAGLALHAFQQQRALAGVRAELELLRERATQASTQQPAGIPRPQAVPQPAARPAEAAGAVPARPAPSEAPRAAVTHDEIARVESAMLSLLEADRPELREKLRAVVQEQQEAIMHERQEMRRERWIARAEGQLAELTGDAALSAEQRRAIVDIVAGNRDQIVDVMRNAETSKDYANARETRRRLRDEADARVRELLTAPQYEGYKQVFTRDEDDDERRPPPR